MDIYQKNEVIGMMQEAIPYIDCVCRAMLKDMETSTTVLDEDESAYLGS